jgi:hypothetical protein
MKKTILLILAGNFLFSVIFSQKSTPAFRHEDLKIKNFNRKIIEFKSSKDLINLQNLRSIEVVDARPDTAVIGLALIAKHIPFFAVSKGGFASDVQQFLDISTHLSKSDSFSVVMFIKKFWLTGSLDEEMEQQIENTNINTSSKKISSLLARIEFYLKKGPDYYILYRFDTTIARNLYVARDAAELAEQGLISSLSRLKDMEVKFQSISETKRKIRINEIEDYNHRQFDLPILKDSTLVRGVYFSFDEFKNNRPGQREFEVEKDHLIDLIFIKQADGKQVPVRETWGYCDGKNLYIQSMDNYFLLQRQGNAYYIYGAKEFKHKKVARDQGLETDSNTTVGETSHYINPLQKTSKRHLALELRPYELDLDNGELN